MNLAAALLADTTQTVGEVAYRVGYSEAAAFTHAFTRHFGESPRRARSSRARGTHLD